MSLIPMCKLCGEYEIAMFQVHNDFCSDLCADKAYDAVIAEVHDEIEAMQSQYDERDRLLDELQDLRAEMRETIAAIEAIQGEIDWG